MVIGKEFAWGHLPKTGGDATAAMFRLFPDIVVFADSGDDKHTPFASRETQIRDRVLVSNMRRLPNWTLSWAHWRAGFPRRDGSPRQLESPADMANIPRADRVLSTLTDNGRFRMDRWLRMERLAGDFAAFVSQFRDLSDAEQQRLATFERVNALDYDHDLRQWFTPRQVRRMYEHNPLWTAVEQRVYGDLALLSG